MTDERMYHIGFGRADLAEGTTIALLSGDPERSEHIATEVLGGGRVLSRHRGLAGFAAALPGGRPVVCATSGMARPPRASSSTSSSRWGSGRSSASARAARSRTTSASARSSSAPGRSRTRAPPTTSRPPPTPPRPTPSSPSP
ncbi:MAG: hypothetical protein R2711_06380 [Acidimicrobiales bacterium]